MGYEKAAQRKEYIDSNPAPGTNGIKGRQNRSNGRTKSAALGIGNSPEVMHKNKQEGK
jgi:hypothetical protein